MGMYSDNLGAQRTQWTYIYSGEQLLPYAQKLYKLYYLQEEQARQRMAGFMRDMTVNQNDTKVQETKRDIEKYGQLKEQCEVFQHEFQRNMQHLYELGLGDVTFFGLTQVV